MVSSCAASLLVVLTLFAIGVSGANFHLRRPAADVKGVMKSFKITNMNVNREPFTRWGKYPPAAVGGRGGDFYGTVCL